MYYNYVYNIIYNNTTTYYVKNEYNDKVITMTSHSLDPKNEKSFVMAFFVTISGLFLLWARCPLKLKI